MKSLLSGLKQGWSKPTPPGTRRTGLVLGGIVGWAVVSAAAG